MQCNTVVHEFLTLYLNKTIEIIELSNFITPSVEADVMQLIHMHEGAWTFSVNSLLINFLHDSVQELHIIIV